MSGRGTDLKPNAQIREEAAAWFVEWSEGELSAEAREAFSLWLKASPEHVRAYLQISATFDDSRHLGNRCSADAETLIRAALADRNVAAFENRRASESAAQLTRETLPVRESPSPARRWRSFIPLGRKILPPPSPRDPESFASQEDAPAVTDGPSRARQRDFFIFLGKKSHESPRSDASNPASPSTVDRGISGHPQEDKKFIRRARDARTPATNVSSRWSAPRGRFAASIALALVGLAALALWANAQRGVYATGIGEQRIVNLADGSTIELNAQSRLRVRFGKSERLVDLSEGQALFHVAKDPHRPFIVRADGTRIRAVGTQFDVNRHASDTVVTVLEGRVAIARTDEAKAGTTTGDTAPTEHAPWYASAGEQVILTAQAASKPAHPDVAAATAWRERKLIFSSSPLPVVVGEYNRYHEKRLVIADPSLSDFRISGVFSAADNTSLIAFLRSQPNIEVEDQDGKIILKSR